MLDGRGDARPIGSLAAMLTGADEVQPEKQIRQKSAAAIQAAADVFRF